MTVDTPGLTAIPNRQYKLVYLDIPWKTETWSDKGLGRSPERHYDTMTWSEFVDLWHALGFDDVLHRDVWLAMWTTPPHLENAFRVLHALGFKFSSEMPWVKLDQSGRPVAGTGKVSLGVTEPLIVAKRGSPPRKRPLPGIIMAPRRKHSQKPEGTHALLERSFDGPGLELFARGTARPGWHFWGNQVGMFEGSGT